MFFLALLLVLARLLDLALLFVLALPFVISLLLSSMLALPYLMFGLYVSEIHPPHAAHGGVLCIAKLSLSLSILLGVIEDLSSGAMFLLT